VSHRNNRSSRHTAPMQRTGLASRLERVRQRRMLPSLANTSMQRAARALAQSPGGLRLQELSARWCGDPLAGTIVLVVGMGAVTLLLVAIDRIVPTPLPNPGLIYLPLVAMLAYHWGWPHAAVAGLLELGCVYVFFIPPDNVVLKPVDVRGTEQIAILAAVTGFVLALVWLARVRRAGAEREAGRFAALNQVGTALASEHDETHLLHLIAETARDLTGAEFAAFTLRPVNEFGQPLVPAEGSRFHLAAVVGVTREQEALFQRMPLGGEGLLAPIFRHGVPVLVADALAAVYRAPARQSPDGPGSVREGHPLDVKRGEHGRARQDLEDVTRRAAFAYAHGLEAPEGLRAVGVPRGHPVIRSFLGAPLLDHAGQVRGGLLLGHSEPGIFTHEDQALLVGLAAQAGVALENVRLYRAARTQAQELDATFESIADGVTVVDGQGRVIRENSAARRLREAIAGFPDSARVLAALLQEPAQRAMRGEARPDATVSVTDSQGETREYLISAALLRPTLAAPQEGPGAGVAGAPTADHPDDDRVVIVWHDVTEARRLLAERRARAEAETRRALLQMVIDELPSSVCLVRGRDAQLVLANRTAAEIWGAPWPEGQPMEAFLAASGTCIFREDGRPLPSDEFATLRVLRTGASIRHHQEVIRHQDGTTLPVLVNAVAIDPQVLNWSSVDAADSCERAAEPAALVVHQDVTPLKETERLKDEFIAIAAHELRTPMAALKGFAEMLIVQTARGKGPPLADWQQEAIADIDRATIRLVELTDDLLDVTRLQAGRLELHPEPVDLVALVKRVAARLQVTAERHQIRIHARCAHVIANIDPRRSEQVVGNLLSNAIKYSPDGGAIDVTITVDREPGMAMLRVRDYGIGIPAHQQAQVFSRFVRADNAQDRGIKGTGLGLYLSRELVERQGGRIWFKSIEGQGSTFFVALPLASEQIRAGGWSDQ